MGAYRLKFRDFFGVNWIKDVMDPKFGLSQVQFRSSSEPSRGGSFRDLGIEDLAFRTLRADLRSNFKAGRLFADHKLLHGFGFGTSCTCFHFRIEGSYRLAALVGQHHDIFQHNGISFRGNCQSIISSWHDQTGSDINIQTGNCSISHSL